MKWLIPFIALQELNSKVSFDSFSSSNTKRSVKTLFTGKRKEF